MTLKEWKSKRQDLRAGFFRILGKFPERKPVRYETLDPKIEFTDVQRQVIEEFRDEYLANYLQPDEKADNPAYRRLHIRYPSALNGEPVYAFLRIPRNLKAKAPALLCLHGHVPGCFFGKESMDVTAIELTERGYVTLAPDMFPFGERRDLKWEKFEWENGKGSAHFWGERAWFQTLLLNGQTLQGLHVWELERAIDILNSLDEVDANRIGSMGHSGGGINTLWISAMDERVACAASCAGVQSYSRLAELRYPTAVWGLAPILSVGDTPDIVSLVAPRPFMGVEGVGDNDFNAEYNKVHVYPKVREVYRLYGAEEKLVHAIHPGAHDYHKEQRDRMYDWLDRWLRAPIKMPRGRDAFD